MKLLWESQNFSISNESPCGSQWLKGGEGLKHTALQTWGMWALVSLWVFLCMYFCYERVQHKHILLFRHLVACMHKYRGRCRDRLQRASPHAPYMDLTVWASRHALTPRLGSQSSQHRSWGSRLFRSTGTPVARGSNLRFQNYLLGFKSTQVLGGSQRRRHESREIALLHRNVIVIDASRDLLLLSPLLLCQNISQSRLVTCTAGGDGKIHHAKEWGKFRMTENNKQTQEVGSQEHLWPLCVSLKQLGKIRVYEK